MSAATGSSFVGQGSESLQTRFLALVPRIELHARIFFRAITCAAKKADCIAETVALAWQWFVRLTRRGKDVTQFVSALAATAARAVRNGRRLCGRERAKDVLSRSAQLRHGFLVERLPASRRPCAALYALVRGQQELAAYEDRLRDTVTPPPDAAAFRIDFPQFLASLSQRDRDLAMYLSLGHSTQVAAARFGLTCGRVSQLRRRWCAEWRRAQGEEGGGFGAAHAHRLALV